ncbi:uncharacterized protein BDV17DRAFT_82849 [Aspergillus undulatus]|uniref:uncharacterized protein n=1 Tax=Aspergillus undulatus TaxID=1810928 RepID=UPI003CCD7564
MFKEMTTIGQLTQASLRRTQRSLVSPMQAQARRTLLTSTPRLSQPQDEEDHFHDRNKLEPRRAAEASQSATTDEVAHRNAAFDASKTSPESELGSSREQTKKQGDQRDPLGVSAADKDVSHWRDPKEGGAEKNAERGASSSRQSPQKNRTRK